jgi:hypothetical protein
MYRSVGTYTHAYTHIVSYPCGPVEGHMAATSFLHFSRSWARAVA